MRQSEETNEQNLFDSNTFIGFDIKEVKNIKTNELLNLKCAMFNYINSKTLKKKNANYKLAYLNILKELKLRKEQIKEKKEEKIEEQRNFSRKFSEKFSLSELLKDNKEDKLQNLFSSNENFTKTKANSKCSKSVSSFSSEEEAEEQIKLNFLGKKTKPSQEVPSKFEFDFPSFLQDTQIKETKKPELSFGKINNN